MGLAGIAIYIEDFLNGNDEVTYVLKQNTKETLMDMLEGLTDEQEIDWDDATAFLIPIPQMTSSEAYDLMVSFAKKQDVGVGRTICLNGSESELTLMKVFS